MTTSLIGVFTAAAESAQASIEEFCPETCTSTVLDVDLANAATDIPGQVTTALQRDPGITQVYAMWDGAVGLLTPAVASSGSSAQIMGMDGIDESIAAMVEGIAGAGGAA